MPFTKIVWEATRSRAQLNETYRWRRYSTCVLDTWGSISNPHAATITKYVGSDGNNFHLSSNGYKVTQAEIAMKYMQTAETLFAYGSTLAS